MTDVDKEKFLSIMNIAEGYTDKLMNNLGPKAKEKIRTTISDMEEVIKKEIQLECPLIHRFSQGVYAREIFIPKGGFIVGKIHKYKNLNVITKGEVSFFSIDGAVRVKAPHTFVASPGVKRVIYAHEDTFWMTIHGTKETDIEKIEEEVIAKDYSEVPEEVNLMTGEIK